METSDCVIGAGAIGLSLAAFLAKERPIALYAHHGQAEALRRAGVAVTGDHSFQLSPHALHISTEPSELPLGARYWICVKAFHLAPLAATLSKQLRSGTTILIANGLGLYNDLVAAIGRSPIVRALPSYGAQRVGSTEVRISGTPRFEIASSPEDVPAREQVRAALTAIGAVTSTVPTVQVAEWRKLLIATTVTSLASLADQQNRCILENPQLRTLAEDVLGELRSIAEHSGVQLNDIPNEMIFANLVNHASNINSLLVALRSGLPTEIEYTILRPLLAARGHGLLTPHLETIFKLLCCIEQHHLFQQSHG